jgi:cytoskeletal protein RodZ
MQFICFFSLFSYYCSVIFNTKSMNLNKELLTKIWKIILAILVFIGLAILWLIQFFHEITDYPRNEIDYENINPHN